MKYHNHTITIVPMNLGEYDNRLNRVYRIFNKDGKFLNEALTLNTAKSYIDNGYDDSVL